MSHSAQTQKNVVLEGNDQTKKWKEKVKFKIIASNFVREQFIGPFKILP